MKPSASPTVSPSALLCANTPTLGRRLMLLGAAALAAAASAAAAVTDISGTLTQVLDTTVGAGNSARLTADATTYWEGTTAAANVNLNGFQLTLNNGGGNAQTYTGALTGAGSLRLQGRGDATWYPDIQLGGTLANSPAGVTINSGRVQLNKTAGVDALAGPITVATSQTVRIQLLKSNQISDASTITSTSSSGAFYLEMGGFSETIAGLDIKTGHMVDTGTSGILKVTTLSVGGVSQPKGAYTASSGFVIGSGYIDVNNFGPPVIVTAPDAPATPTPVDAATTVNPALLSKLDWADSAGNPTSYDVYLWLAAGTKPATPTANVLLSEYTLGSQVISLSNYKWQVVAKNSVGNTAGPEWNFSTVDRTLVAGNTGVPYSDGTHNLNYIVGIGNSGKLLGNFTLYYDGTKGSFSVPIDTNGFLLNADTGGGNGGHVASGPISGSGSFSITNGPRNNGLWNSIYTISGSSANTYTGGTTLKRGNILLHKTAGVDALPAIAITLGSAGDTARLIWGASNQVNDGAAITVLLPTVTDGYVPDANLNFLDLAGFSDTIDTLVLPDAGTKTQVRTGTGGVLTVTHLSVNGAIKPPGTYTVADGFVVGSGSVVVPGATAPASATLSTLAAAPGSLTADGVSTATITATLLDATGAPAPGKTVTLASSRGASDTIAAASGASDASGVVTFLVKSATPGAPVFTATDTSDTVTLSQTASVTFTALPPASASHSTLAAAPSALRADGVNAATLTVTLLDSGNAAVAGKTVTLASSRGASDTISAASGPSNISGVVTFTVKSTTPGAPVFTATDTTDGITVSQTAGVTFSANPAASLSQSTLVAAPTSQVANGTSTSLLTVTLKESGGSPVAGKTVTLSSSRGASDSISAASGPSDAFGVVTFSVTSLTTGAPVFTATDTTDSLSLSQTASVTFTMPVNAVDVSNTLTPWEPANTAAGVNIDAVVAAGKSARLVGLTQTHWASGGFSRGLNLNENTLIIDSGGGNAMSASGAISGNGLLRVNAGGIGILHFSGAVGNTYTGTTEINSGPVKLEKSSGNALNGPIAVNGAMSNNFPGTGTLLWGADNQVSDTSSLTLGAGASLNFAGFSDTVGALAVTGDASIYLTGSTSIVHFADSSAAAWTAGKQLVIREWNGSPTGGGGEGVFFGSSAGGLSGTQIANVGFMNPAGLATGLYHAAILATGEVVPSGSAVVATAPPYDLSAAAAAARAAFYSAPGRADLTAAGSPLATGTHIVFFGDSITWLNGYITLLNTALASGAGTQGKTITLTNRGINGGTTANLRDGVANGQASFASLLVSDQANIAVVFIGINDIWWAGTTAAAYEQALRDMAASAAAQHVKLIFATPAAHNESPIGADSLDPAIDQFAAIVQTVAADTGATFVNLRAAFVNYWKNNNYEIRLDGSFVTLQTYGLLTYDGVHPTTLGTQLLADQLAEGILGSLSAGSAFDTWAGGKGLTGPAAAFGADPDHDGLANGIEFVLGGDPNPAHAGSNSSGLLPTAANSANALVFTYTRTHEAAYLNPVVEFNTGLQGAWTTATAANATIVVTPGATSDTVTVTLPKAANTSLFARLKVVQP